jgi:hypothetical protein
MATAMQGSGYAHRIPYAFSRTHGVLAQSDEPGGVVVLTRPDATVEGLAELKRVLQRPLLTRAVDAQRFATELARAYNVESGVAQMSEDFARDGDLARLMQDLPPAEDLLDSGAQAPVIRMINALLLQALRERRIRRSLRAVRGALRSCAFASTACCATSLEPPRALHAALVSRVKIMASLDIAEKRLPQDGRLALKLGDKLVDVRVSTLPTGTRRARRAAPARQGFRTARPHGARHERRNARCRRSPDPRAARHRARHRPDRLRQNDDAVRGAVAIAARHAQHDDGRRPDRIRARRRRPDAGQSEDRPRFRARAARDPAARIRTSS